jgi:hypothetical protein
MQAGPAVGASGGSKQREEDGNSSSCFWEGANAMTRAKLLFELSDVIRSYEEENFGQQLVSCSLQIWEARPGTEGAAVGPVFCWDGTKMEELPEPVEVRV